MNGELIVARAFSTVFEAEVARSAVEAAGIDVILGDANIVAADWLYSNAIGGVKLLVAADDLAETQALLDTTADTGIPGLVEPCASCGSADFDIVEEGKRAAVLTWLVLGIPLARVRRFRRCRSCGTQGS